MKAIWPFRSPFATGIRSPILWRFLTIAKSTASEVAGAHRRSCANWHVHKIDLVTSNFHTRRAGNIYRAQAPGLEIHVVEVAGPYFTPDGWWKDREGAQDVPDGMDEDRRDLGRNVGSVM